MSSTVDRDLILFHAFQESCLRARRHAIDFIYQEQIREHRPFVKVERSLSHIQNIRADDIRGHQIRGALHSLELHPQQSRKRFYNQSFCNPWNSFQEGVAPAEECNQALVLKFLLADDDFAHFLTQVTQ
jgi:hypothetical protein